MASRALCELDPSHLSAAFLHLFPPCLLHNTQMVFLGLESPMLALGTFVPAVPSLPRLYLQVSQFKQITLSEASHPFCPIILFSSST